MSQFWGVAMTRHLLRECSWVYECRELRMVVLDPHMLFNPTVKALTARALGNGGSDQQNIQDSNYGIVSCCYEVFRLN